MKLVVVAMSVLALGQTVFAASASADWTHQVEGEPVVRKKKTVPVTVSLWLPKGVDRVRGLLFPGPIGIGAELGRDPVVRKTLTDLGMGVIFFEPAIGSGFIKGAGGRLDAMLEKLAKESGHAELKEVPLLTIGHSADGHFARAVGYWKPERTIGIILLKSGNFHHAIEDPRRSLAGIPLVMISGEFEEYGPEGGDLGVGLRARYSSHPTEKKKLNQTQWVMARMQMLERRRRNPENLWALVVHRGRGHTAWDDEMRDLTCQMIRSFAGARLPADSGRCRPVTAADGWLYDADIKEPRFDPASSGDYNGNRFEAFWVPDQALADAIFAYHGREWPHPDPTRDEDPQSRFYPPEELNDPVDLP